MFCNYYCNLAAGRHHQRLLAVSGIASPSPATTLLLLDLNPSIISTVSLSVSLWLNRGRRRQMSDMVSRGSTAHAIYTTLTGLQWSNVNSQHASAQHAPLLVQVTHYLNMMALLEFKFQQTLFQAATKQHYHITT